MAQARSFGELVADSNQQKHIILYVELEWAIGHTLHARLHYIEGVNDQGCHSTSGEAGDGLDEGRRQTPMAGL